MTVREPLVDFLSLKFLWVEWPKRTKGRHQAVFCAAVVLLAVYHKGCCWSDVVKAECSVFGLTFWRARPAQAVFLQHLVPFPLCVAGHISLVWRESGLWVSGRGASGVGSIGQLWSKL